MKKENITLIVGLSIPVVMVLFIAGAIYLPSLFVDVDPPKFSFMYMTNNSSDGYSYSVKKNNLSREKIERKNKSYSSHQRQVRFFIHNIKTHKNKELSFEEASAVSLNSNIESPDGFKIENGRSSYGFFPFYSRGNYYTRYITKDNYAEKVKLHTNSTNYYYNFRFLGWLTKEE
jgi:hypothetical protein